MSSWTTVLTHGNRGVNVGVREQQREHDAGDAHVHDRPAADQIEARACRAARARAPASRIAGGDEVAVDREVAEVVDRIEGPLAGEAGQLHGDRDQRQRGEEHPAGGNDGSADSRASLLRLSAESGQTSPSASSTSATPPSSGGAHVASAAAMHLGARRRDRDGVAGGGRASRRRWARHRWRRASASV